jgi:hypothetical protein
MVLIVSLMLMRCELKRDMARPSPAAGGGTSSPLLLLLPSSLLLSASLSLAAGSAGRL